MQGKTSGGLEGLVTWRGTHNSARDGAMHGIEAAADRCIRLVIVNAAVVQTRTTGDWPRRMRYSPARVSDPQTLRALAGGGGGCNGYLCALYRYM